jgi:hypothetical protein
LIPFVRSKAERAFGQDGHAIGGREGVEQEMREEPQRTAQVIDDPSRGDPGRDDARATALMVLGPDKCATLARQSGLDALFLLRDDDASARGVGVGRLFSEEPAAFVSAEKR